MGTNDDKLQVCTQCDVAKTADHFYLIRNPKYQVKYCNECVAINIKKWKENS